MTSHINVTPTNQRLFPLVKEASEGKLALPQFQRSFVWSPEDVKDLLLSVFKQYFIGSLLLMDIDPHSPPFALRAVEGSEISEQSLRGVSSRLLLDGQQRITSLYYAFYAPDIPLKGRAKNPTRFFIDLKKFFEDDVDNAIFYKPENRCKQYEFEVGDWQFKNLIVPLKELLAWSRWSGAYAVWLADEKDRLVEWTKNRKPVWDKKVNSVFNYDTSVLTLSKIDANNSYQLEEVCTVFEKLNSTGVTLTVFDLLTARLYPKGIHLDELWSEALEKSKIFSQFVNIDKSAFGVLILRCIALMRGVDLKSKALINLSDFNFSRDWRRAICYFDEAYTRLTSLQDDGFGVFNQKWLPYTTIIPVLAALLAQRDSLDSSKKAHATQAIQWWYWGAVFTVRFSGPVETVTHRDYNELKKYFEDKEQYPEVFREIHSDILRDEADFSLLQVARSSNILYRAIMCLLALNGARDFRKNESITFSELEDHHIFPKSYLKTNYTKATLGNDLTTLRNTIVNRTLISTETNRAISSKPPGEYVHDDSVIAQDKLREILHRHFIDDESIEALEQNEYEIFLLQRETVILERIKSLFNEMPRPCKVDPGFKQD